MQFEKYRQPVFWKNKSEDPAFKSWISQLKAEFDVCKQKPAPFVSYTKRRFFYETGNRSAMEVPYFEKRSFLAVSALLALLFPESKEYIDALHDLLWDVCEEYNWILPAHTASPIARDKYVDLFCTETGAALSEICWYLGDRIDPDVRALVKANLEEKLFKPFAENTYPWEKMKMNWTAVCISQMAIAMLFSEPSLFEENIPRFNRAMECFMEGFPEDGSCLEGLGYWQYGFGRFVYYADALSKYTEGKTDLFDDPKVKRVAEFAPKCCIHGGEVTFSDAMPRVLITEDLAQYIHDKLEAPLLPEEYRTFGGRWMERLRALLYARPNRKAAPLVLEDHYFKEGGQLIINKKGYSLALKAGFNDEPHNHNDVGHFIISADEGQLLCDIGSATYTLQYFRADTRYTDYLCNSSEGHSVPVIDGCFQKPGREYAGTLEYRGGCSAEIEMAGAYGLEQLKGLKRAFRWTDESVTVTDVYEGSFKTAVERFVSLVKPCYENGVLSIGRLSAKAPGCSISERTHRPHAGAPEGKDIKVYLIDVPLKPGEKRFEITFTIKDKA
ncbi:MAG: heparinase II/III family protein [Abditibacteriota bacterium]|nr:heparinase II/III family protein [Abditibacteriota bacterium]